jgi:F-type H+-transporting ATPase subunit delta
MSIDRTLIRATSAVYAEVLLDAARDGGAALEVSGQLGQVLAVIRGNVELRDTLTDRILPHETRVAIVREVFASLDEALVGMLAVMVERDEIGLLDRVSEAYTDLVERKLDALILDVTTVVELDDNLRAGIKKKYSAQCGRDVLLREHIDPSLVGGVVLSAHGRRIDASVVSQLENARAMLSTVSSGGDG